MIYGRTKKAKFIDRPNRFIAHVDLEGRQETVHVKNTGRCRELLIPGVDVILEEADKPERKTAYDLITVYKDGLGWVNIDSQVPNKLVREYLEKKDFDLIKQEYRYGDSRIDFYMEKGTERYLMEVKGCTLEIGGKGYFPDAPTERGVKHLRELIRAKSEGYHAIAAFVITMEKVTEVIPNEATHPGFAKAYNEAVAAGVEIWNLPCRVYEDRLEITEGTF